MSRKVFTSPRFNGGMILNADPSDLPEGFGVAAFNTMPSLDSGSIGGRYADTPSATPYTDVEHYAYITKNGATQNLVYAKASNNRHVWVDGADIDDLTQKGYAVKCITGHRNYALLGVAGGLPYYYGYPKGLTAVACSNDFGALCSINVYEEPPTKENGEFESGALYSYAASVVYDGYMHGPLSPVNPGTPSSTSEWGNNGSQFQLGVISNQLRINITVPTSDTYVARATSINLYRSVRSAGLNDASQTSEYVRIAEFTDIDSNITFTDTNHIVTGANFTTLSGLDETLTFCNLGYEVAYEMNNFLFVGNVGYVKDGAQQFPEGSRLLYRSMRGKHSQFHIINDYVALPFIPKAITSYNNRLVVFGSAEFALVNPETLIIEEVVHGYGVESALCVHSTLHGVFFANKNNMYIYDGQTVAPIGAPVMRSFDTAVDSQLTYMNVASYETIVALHNGIQKVVYSARINSILFLYSVSYNSVTTTYAYVFSLDTKTWAVYSFGVMSSARSAFIDRNNVLYIGSVAAMAESDKVPGWKYLTKRFTLGEATQWKKIYNINLNMTSTYADFSASYDSNEFVALSGSSVASVFKRARTLMLSCHPAVVYASYLNSIEITYREMLNTK